MSKVLEAAEIVLLCGNDPSVHGSIRPTLREVANVLLRISRNQSAACSKPVCVQHLKKCCETEWDCDLPSECKAQLRQAIQLLAEESAAGDDACEKI